MQYTTLVRLLALAPIALAEHIVDYDDIPGVCVAPCLLTVELSQRCDQQTSNDSDYRRCYCPAADAGEKHEQDCGWDYAAITTSGGPATATATVIIVSSSGGDALTTSTALASTTTTASTDGAPRATAVVLGSLVAAGIAVAIL
ncbi:hypothetical protein PG994_008078 [Apiospora phragmitis]|uniref:Extracellular membrane protein CFEM domain-containing protein n=1 Tax=Apiospora phragmitis TaxID=2905665 RepID=A0ABR1US04_9PEZI